MLGIKQIFGVTRIRLVGALGRLKKMDDASFGPACELIADFTELSKSFGVISDIYPHKNTRIIYEPETDNVFAGLIYEYLFNN